MSDRDLLRSLLHWSKDWNYAALYSSNNIADQYGEFDWIFAVGDNALTLTSENHLSDLDNWLANTQGHFRFGVLSYELRNRFEDLPNNNSTPFSAPDVAFFQAECLVYNRNGTIYFEGVSKEDLPNIPFDSKDNGFEPFHFESAMDFAEYSKSFQEVKRLIQLGDLYEMNLCRPFYSQFKNKEGLAESVFLHLVEDNPAVQSAFFKHNEHRIVSVSPERFLRRKGRQLISEPIKGTAPRNSDPVVDQEVQDTLRNSVKERSENVMIVDLVRNDLSRLCEPGSVEVDELFSIRTLPKVHQMVSVVTGTIEGDKSFEDILGATFPMGSMTGAPKVSAMTAADDLEVSQRSWYSGSLGYIAPNGDFDFNVLIRTLFLDTMKEEAMIGAGGAITAKSELESEFEETELKAQSVISALSGSVIRPTSENE